ncbi:MAG: hypothetical protein ACC726_10345 [Chloroflexota bacterium]
MEGKRCEAVERADVLVYDIWATTESEGGRRSIGQLRDLYPDIPVLRPSIQPEHLVREV